MDRYQKVVKPKTELPINENEIRITSQGLIRNYISYASSLLQEKRGEEIVLKAMGQAISKAVNIAEIIKKKILQLYQDTSISSVSITDVWEPIEEGLVPVEMTRHVSMISITLSTKEINKNSPGYQAPHVEQSKTEHDQQHQPPKQTRGRYNAEDTYGRGRGRGRGRGWRWSRGGYGGYYDNGGYSNYGLSGGYGYQDNGGYSNWSRGGGRGRGWGAARGSGSERGRGGGGRVYGRDRGRMGGRTGARGGY